MKKLLGIVVLGLLLSKSLLAANYLNPFNSFNQWLLKNGHNQYLVKDSEGRVKHNLNINPYKERWSIPYAKNPNRDTLIYYNYKNLFGHFTDGNSYQFGKYEISPSKNPYEFKSDLIEDKFVKKQMQKKALLSYLYFQDDHIIVDEITPKNRFGEFVNNETKLRSNSVGKSMVSYVLGHAICEGYIEGVDSTMNDWPLVENTLYENQKLIDLINMNAGDYKYINNSLSYGGFLGGFDTDTNSIWKTMHFFKNKKKSKPKYNYHDLLPNIVFNYILFKSGSNFQKILDKAYKEKAKIKNSVYFFKLNERQEYGNAHNMFFATRYDWLRIAKAVMDDYQNDTCVGKYLKNIFERRIPKNVRGTDFSDPAYGDTSTYGGYFHLEYPGLKNREVLGMTGYGGQAILIDMENSRIVMIHSIHFNNTKYKYNVRKLLIDPIKKGK
tara:strand:- start:29 stop:1345 length:1317 start_codon:yes stop_codon:yes gene_type:complete